MIVILVGEHGRPVDIAPTKRNTGQAGVLSAVIRDTMSRDCKYLTLLLFYQYQAPKVSPSAS